MKNCGEDIEKTHRKWRRYMGVGNEKREKKPNWFFGIPCTIWKWQKFHDNFPRKKNGDWVFVYSTRTYWGAKRLKKKMERVNPNFDFQITEAWNPPYPYDVGQKFDVAMDLTFEKRAGR